MSKDISIEVENLGEVQASIRSFGARATNTVLEVVKATAFRIESMAKSRLQGLMGSDRHIVTSRLITSVHAEAPDENTFIPLPDVSQVRDGELAVPFAKDEAIVGTNVEYAQKIEHDYDSYLRYAGEHQEPKYIKEMQKQLNELIKEREASRAKGVTPKR